MRVSRATAATRTRTTPFAVSPSSTCRSRVGDTPARSASPVAQTAQCYPSACARWSIEVVKLLHRCPRPGPENCCTRLCLSREGAMPIGTVVLAAGSAATVGAAGAAWVFMRPAVVPSSSNDTRFQARTSSRLPCRNPEHRRCASIGWRSSRASSSPATSQQHNRSTVTSKVGANGIMTCRS